MEKNGRRTNQVKYFVKNEYQQLPVFIDDLRSCDDIPYIYYPHEYHGQPSVKMVCTQHYNCFYRPDVTPYKQNKITQTWIEFFRAAKQPLKRVQLCSRTPQKVFDALCMQDSIEFLRLKWCAVSDLSAIRNLKNLRQLYIGIGTSVTSISPLSDLENLEALCLDNTIKVTDYSPLGKLKNLVALDIGGNFQSKALIDMETDDFLFRLKRLEFLHLPDVRVANRKFLFPENVLPLKYACFRI